MRECLFAAARESDCLLTSLLIAPTDTEWRRLLLHVGWRCWRWLGCADPRGISTPRLCYAKISLGMRLGESCRFGQRGLQVGDGCVVSR